MVLRLNNVSVRYATGKKPAVENCGFSVRPGEKIALVGCNGSGKSTLLLAIAGLVSHSGDITVDGIKVSRTTLKTVRQRLGFLFSVPDDQLLFPDPVQDIAFALTRRGTPRDQARDEALKLMDTLGIADLSGASVHALSHGQRMRVALAGTIITKPPLLLLDEPSGGLDPPGRTALARRLVDMDSAMLIATHDLDFARRVCSGWILLENGSILRQSDDMDALLHLWD